MYSSNKHYTQIHSKVENTEDLRPEMLIHSIMHEILTRKKYLILTEQRLILSHLKSWLHEFQKIILHPCLSQYL